MQHQPLWPLWLSTCLAIALPSALHSQQGGENEADVFNLDPFEVVTDNVGYQARNSLSATKFAIEVKSVPITVSSLTLEFLEDTYTQTLDDAISFSAGVTTGASQSAEEGDSFYIRGLRTSRTKRNGIVQLYTQDLTNVQKVEVVKGPMSLLYGQVEPGGLINYLTRNAMETRQTELKLTVGSDDHFRAQLNHTGPILKGDKDGAGRLLYRVDASYKVDDGWRDNTEDERSFWSGLVEYKPFKDTTIEVQWDYLNQNAYNAGPLPKINKVWMEIFQDLVAGTDPANYASLTTLAKDDPWTSYTTYTRTFPSGDTRIYANKDPDDPSSRLFDAYAEHWPWETNPVPINAFNDVDQHTISLELRQRLWQEWYAKLYIVHHDIYRHSVWGNMWGMGISGENGPGYSSNHFKRYNDDWSYQLEITGKWDLGPVNNQTIIGFEYLDHDFDNFLAQSNDSVGEIVRKEIYEQVKSSPTNPYYLQSAAIQNLSEISVDLSSPLDPRRDQEDETKSVFISNVTRMFSDRWLVLGGVRYDEIEILGYLPGSEPRELESEFYEDAVTPQVGTSFSLNENLTVYASYSESFVPQTGTVAILKQGDELEEQKLIFDPKERILTNSEAKVPYLGAGYEFGAKFDFLDGKISGSMSVFHIELTGVTNKFYVNVPGFKNEITEKDEAGNEVVIGYEDVIEQVLVNSQDNGREIDGFETELFLRPLPGLQVVLTYAYLDSVELLATQVSEIRGDKGLPLTLPSVSVPQHQAGVWTKYSFREGRLDGAYIGGGFSWMDKRYGAYSLRSSNPSAGGFVGSDESIEDKIPVDAQITWDMVLGYKFNMGKADCNLQLNIKNIFDERFINPGGMPNNPRQAYLSLHTKF